MLWPIWDSAAALTNGKDPSEPEGHCYDHGLPPSPPTSASEGEEEDDCGQFKQETVAVKQEVANDFMAKLGFDGTTDERALITQFWYMMGQEPEGHGYDHGLPPSPPTSTSEGERGRRLSRTVQTRNRR